MMHLAVPAFLCCLLLHEVRCTKPLNLRLTHEYTKVPIRPRSKFSLTQDETSPGDQVKGDIIDQTVGGDILPYGLFWFTFSVGTPPVEYRMGMDTGSTFTFVSLKGCDGCKKSWNLYNPTDSSTSAKVLCDTPGCNKCVEGQCSLQASYITCVALKPLEQCSLEGPIFEDVFQIGGVQPNASLTFAGIQTSKPLYFDLTNLHGLMGIIPNQNFFGRKSPLDILIDEGLVPDNGYGMCFTPNGVGHITIGGKVTDYYTGDFQWTPIVNDTFWNVGGRGLSVDSNPVGDKGDTTVVIDSGTNVLLLPNATYWQLADTFDAGWCSTIPNVCKSASPNLFDQLKCFQFTEEEIAKFPIIKVELQGATLELLPKWYLLPRLVFPVPQEPAGDPAKGEWYCLAIENGISKNTPFIVGASIMTEYYAYFDIANKMIGWAPVNKENCFKDPTLVTTGGDGAGSETVAPSPSAGLRVAGGWYLALLVVSLTVL
eukprot:TRINITY_DN31351_c0_g1_i1.p1 TRINITY_DN31351_c0_g1~~TRINITY_DN31351_c0_g1_i1.p1  ORF type:complete len:484 (-),score=44.50 TRINITY_DN31351_c0_g1_i1:103-1554(-)